LNRAGVLLDTGPLVALLSKDDTNHGRAEQLFGSCQTPLRCPEAVLAEACFLMRKVDKAGPAEVLALGRKGVYELSISIEKHWANLEALLKKYADRPISRLKQQESGSRAKPSKPHADDAGTQVPCRTDGRKRPRGDCSKRDLRYGFGIT
jgi:predicted nucleic acid-binding protein